MSIGAGCATTLPATPKVSVSNIGSASLAAKFICFSFRQAKNMADYRRVRRD
jgi:hypothetical protein